MAKTAPYRTGFCGIGLHEGTSPTGVSGGPLKVCVAWLDCACQCHVELTELFRLTGRERTPQQNPKWVPQKSTFVMPTLEERVISRASTLPRNGPMPNPVTVAPPTIKRDAAGILPPVMDRSFAPTPTGRTARGELEGWVLEQTNGFAVESKLDPTFKALCTPAWIVDEIAKQYGIKPPSTGAVTAVLDRWALIGFATIARKPVRFMGYTKDGLEFGLESMKLKAKQKPSKSAAMERVTSKKRA